MNKKAIFIILGILILLIIGATIYKMTGNTIKTGNSQVLLKTSEGDIVIELYSDKAPETVTNFLSYVKDGSYDGTVFHRVMDGFMIQGGGFDENGKERDTRDPIKLESDNGLKNDIGTVAMARTADPDSATNQFFINTNDNYFLDHGYRDEGYAVFGKVIKGMDVVKKIEKHSTGVKHSMSDWPVVEVKITSAEVI